MRPTLEEYIKQQKENYYYGFTNLVPNKITRDMKVVWDESSGDPDKVWSFIEQSIREAWEEGQIEQDFTNSIGV